jgi:hypothetical protein
LLSGTGGIPSPPDLIHFALCSMGGVSGFGPRSPSGYAQQNTSFTPKEILSTLSVEPT